MEIEPTRTGTHAPRWVIIVAGLAAPVFAWIALRLTWRSCTVLNPLGQPWPEPWEDVGVVTFAALALIMVAVIISGFRLPSTRATSAVVLALVVSSSVPVLFTVFISVFGDQSLETCVRWR